MSLFILPTVRATDANGLPLPGATLTFYVTGTTTLANTYTTSALATPHANPVVADAGGLFEDIYLDPSVTYRVVLKSALGVTISDVDPYTAADSSAQTVATRPNLASLDTGLVAILTESGREGTFVFDDSDLSAQVTIDTAQGIYIAPSTDTTGASGAWVRTFDGSPSVKWFGAVGDGTTNDTAAINSAATAAAGKALYFPGGTYLVTDAITIPSNCRVHGDGDASLIKSTSLVDSGANGGQRQFDVRSVSGVIIEDLAFDNSALTVFGSGTRNIYCNGSSKYVIRNCKFTTCGAAVASVNCSEYRIEGNRITMSATDGVTHNDGTLDQWWGSHGFVIANNRIDGASIGKYSIIVTGEQTDGTAAACYDFLITGNSIKNSKVNAISVNGRSGVNYDFQIVNNRIDTVTDFFGIYVTDSKRFAVSGNTIRNVEFNAIRISLESGEGTYACTDGVVAHNVIEDANMGLSTSDLSGSAIGVDSVSARIAVGPNTVKGSNHRYAVFFISTSSACELIGGGTLQAGTQGVVLNGSTSNRTPGYSTYTPTLTSIANVSASAAFGCRYQRVGDTVKVNGRVDVTPTAAASTSTSLNISLPIASNLGNTDLAGNAATQFGTTAGISADITNDAATLKFPATNTSNNSFYFTFEYKVI